MVHSTLNIFDLGVFGIIGLSALLSFFRGFSREVLSLGAWIGASIITLYAFPSVSKWLEPQVGNPMVASGLASVGVFMVALVLISILTGVMMKFMKSGSDVGLLDNFVGLIFGAARGALLVAIGYFIFTLVTPEKEYPAWIKDSVTRPYVAKASSALAKMVPSYLGEIKPLKDKNKTDQKDEEHESHSFSGKPRVIYGQPKKESGELPSFEELQRRIRQENEGK